MAAAGLPDGSVLTQNIDSYDPATRTVTIPLVQVGIRYFRDVRATVGDLVSVGTASNVSGVFDRYDFATNRLTVPVVRVGNSLYFNVVVTVGDVQSVGGEVASFSVPTDLSQVSYPQSYQTVTTNPADINTDPCKLDVAAVNYPATWMGRYPLPPIQGAPLKASIQRGAILKDIGLLHGNPAFILPGFPGAPAGCQSDLHAALDRTILRLKALGADFVSVPQYHWASNREDGSWYFQTAEDSYGALTDADLAYLVQKAHSVGLKVLLRNMIQGYFDRSNPLVHFVPPPTMSNVQKWFGAWRPYVAERATVFQSMGVDIWELGCGACMFNDVGDRTAEAKALFASEYQTSLEVRKSVFTGKSLMNDSPLLYDPPPGTTSLATQVDIIQIGIGVYNIPSGFTDTLSVPNYKNAVGNTQGVINIYDVFGKTILITYNAQSRGNFFTLPGYMEEVVCQPFGSADPSLDNSCIERATLTDFSLQAIVHEATLEIVNSLTTQKSPLMVEAMDYWGNDSLMPFTAFPNIATSFRNKPSEGIVKAWFAR